MKAEWCSKQKDGSIKVVDVTEEAKKRTISSLLQPERSKREDRKLCDACGVNYYDPNCECGTLNIVETQ
jgi:hypothetical protein